MSKNDAVSQIQKALAQAKRRIYEKRHWEENEVRMEIQDAQLELIDQLLSIFMEVD